MFLAVSRKLFLSALFVAAALAVHAQDAKPGHERIEQLMQSLNRGHFVGQVAVSPDGRRLAWIEGVRGGTDIHLAPLGDLNKFVRITAAQSPEQHCAENGITWAPDSASVAFFSDCADPGDQTDLYLSKLDGAAGRRITQLRGYVGAPAFSPDGKSVAFLYVAGATRQAGALAAMKPPSGVIGEDGIEIQRIAVAPADPEAQPVAPRLVSPDNLHVYEFDWAPDSRSVAYIAADPPGENNWWVAKLYTEPLDSPNCAPGMKCSMRTPPSPTAILAPAEVAGALHGLQIAVPRWSPDGKTIAFIGGLMSDQGATGGDVYTIPAIGGEPQNLTPGRAFSASWIEWAGNQHIFVSEIAGGNSQLVRLSLDGSSAAASKPVFSFPGSIGDGRLELSLSATADHAHFLFHASSFDRPDEIYDASTADAAGLSQLSHFNAGAKPAIEPAWGKSASVEWTSDSFRVQGWLLFPKDYDPAKKYPLIIEVHGGPASAVLPRWGGSWALSPTAFSALGYFVLQPNPRGSYGQGEAFTQANRKDFGYGDLRDILAGVDAVVDKYPVDSNRVGLTGWSYGGFMTMFAVTQTHRFKAAVVGAGISDWLSYYGENSIDQWMIPYFGASVYDDPPAYAKSSAISYIKQTTTPTLAVVGDRDGECPAPQSFEFWHALRDLRVPAQLVVYPNEGHGFVDPAHSRDVLERAVDWFERYMPPAR
jgi:dipeptidyl aminopeptidase/acylaminoacyl peptidase